MNFVAQDFKSKREDLFQVSLQAQLITKQVVVMKVLALNSNDVDYFIMKILLWTVSMPQHFSAFSLDENAIEGSGIE